MKFVQYIGKGALPGLTDGKLYVASEFINGDNQRCLTLNDDLSTRIIIDDENDFFRYFDGAYAAWLNPDVDVGLEVGDIVYIDDVDDNMFRMANDGRCFNAENFQLIDHTNFLPGFFVFDECDDQWHKVISVYDNSDISLEASPNEKRPMSDFRLHVSGKTIQPLPPLLVCTDGNGREITTGQEYELVEMDGDMVTIRNDNGELKQYMAERFQP